MVDSRLVWVAVGGFAVNVEVFGIASFLPGMATDTAVGMTQAGYLITGYSLSFAIGAPIMASIFASLDRRAVLSLAAATFGVLTLAAALAAGYWQLLATRMALGLIAGLFSPLALATAAALAPPDGRGQAISIVVSGQTAAIAIGVPLVALMTTQFGWRAAYLVLTGIGAVAAIALWVMLPSGIRGVALTLRERLSSLAIPGVAPTYAVSVLLLVGGFLHFFYLGALTTRFLELAPWWIPLVLLGYGLGAVAGNLVGGKLNDRWGSVRVILLGLGATILLLPLLSILPALPRPLVGPAWWCFQFSTAFAAWAYYPGQISRLSAFRPSATPLILSLNGTANNLGTAIAGLLGGVVIDRLGFTAIGPIAAIFVLAAFLVMLAMAVRRDGLVEPRR